MENNINFFIQSKSHKHIKLIYLPMVQILGSVQMTHEDYKSKTVYQWHKTNIRVFKTAYISHTQHQKHCQITT